MVKALSFRKNSIKSVKLKRQQEQYSKFSEKAGVLTRNERNQVAGFGHSEASKANWAAKKKTTASKGGSPGSSGHAVTVNVSPPSTNGGTGKTYQKEVLTNSGGSGKIKTNTVGKTIIEVQRNTLKGEPNSITQKVNKNGGIAKQISNNDHGHTAESKLGKHGEHAHDYYLDENGINQHGKARELTDEERKENSDIL